MYFFSKPQTTFTHLRHSHTIVGTPFLNSLNNDSDKDFSKPTLMSKDSEDRRLEVNLGWKEDKAGILNSELQSWCRNHGSLRGKWVNKFWSQSPDSFISCESGTSRCLLPKGKIQWWAGSAAHWLLIGNISHLYQVSMKTLSAQFAKIYVHT